MSPHSASRCVAAVLHLACAVAWVPSNAPQVANPRLIRSRAATSMSYLESLAVRPPSAPTTAFMPSAPPSAPTTDAASDAAIELFVDKLYPEEGEGGYWERNSASRTDGYWEYIKRGEEPPQTLVYGEYPTDTFLEMIDRACGHAGIGPDRSNYHMADLGSGTGRLVLWCAINQRWKSCRGVEYLSSIHDVAADVLERARAAEATDCPGLIKADEVIFECDSWDTADLSNLDVVFVYSTGLAEMVRDESNVLVELTESLNKRLRKGSVVITTEYRLGEGFRLIESADGKNDFIGGVSTAHIHVKESPGDWE
mmetsp:Transcript_11421/g.30767  ORF Transcript_11421/g.30767 Transcript_11421/m.30767 type:complete len:311 (-) Transcript_11421:567-1499(-)|eukprot:CAMPEP_0119483490 /NCGR_PEP_ID=MMETSP1344-20130328/10874_1 /TAXON_ID=236787 /ORGANISM="Florenciella parvula, Strain CCMP2471" /LENGTH=310 /DNA_ID=CAMNT_0007517989 /DNA_START=783 /DNA_END=1715 /DNA_ORIENTATION=+